MRIPMAKVALRLNAGIDLANIFYLDQWGTSNEKTLYFSSHETDVPIKIGPQIEIPLDMANIQEITENGFMTSKLAISILSMIVVYKGLLAPLRRGEGDNKRKKRSSVFQYTINKKSRKKRSTLTNIFQEYIGQWIMAVFENEPKLNEILSKMGVADHRCQERLVCQAYTHLTHLPQGIMDLIVVFSKYLVDLQEYKEAMVSGLGGGGCDSLHPELPLGYCTDPVDLVTQFFQANEYE